MKMSAAKNGLFLLAFSALNAHELDAMSQHEWRLLFVLRDLPEALAEQAFVFLHVPLVAILLWLVFHQSTVVSAWSRRAICAFGVVHLGLHWHLQDHPAYTFHSFLSQLLIVGYAAAGFLYLLADSAETLRSRHVQHSVQADGPTTGGPAA
jgi:hypothetical protein